MARHRAVRGMNLDDEYDEDDDYYSQSVEDNFCISPGTAAQFTFNRGQHTFGSYMRDEAVDEESEEETEHADASPGVMRSQLNAVNQAKLNSCLEEVHNILGETRPDSVYTETIIKHNYNLQATLDELLSQKEAPKPQRAPRQNRRNRSQGDSDDYSDSDQETNSTREDQSKLESNVSKLSSNSNISPSNIGSDQSGISLADLAKGQQGQLGVKVSQDWIKNNVCQNSNIPKLSGLTQALGHMKVGDTKSKAGEFHETADGEVFDSKNNDSVPSGNILSEKVVMIDGLGRSPKSSLSSSAGSESGLSLSQLASLHQQQIPKLSISSLTSKVQSGSPPSQTSSVGSLSLAQLAFKHQKTTVPKGDAPTSSLADLAKQHNSTNTKASGALFLSALKQNNATTGQGSHQLKGPLLQTSSAITSVGTSAGLSLAQLASSHKSSPVGLGSLAQRSSGKMDGPTGVSLASLANAQKSIQANSISSKNSSGPQKPSSQMNLSLSDLLKNKSSVSVITPPSDERTPSPEVQGSNTGMQQDEVSLLVMPEVDPTLLSMPSVLGKALCLLKTRKRKSSLKLHGRKYPRFTYLRQVGGCKLGSPLHRREIKMFDFSTPSPDDLVRQKQRGAFTRTGERHLSS